MFTKVLAALCALACFVKPASSVANDHQHAIKPNIVFILIDDILIVSRLQAVRGRVCLLYRVSNATRSRLAGTAAAFPRLSFAI